IFTARLRILETSIPSPNTMFPPNNSSSSSNSSAEKITTEILLEDPATGDLFAGAPYTDTHVVEAAVDSSRFFAVRVVGEGGMKAMLGIGFEERSEAIDFGICLQECRKVLGFDGDNGTKGKGAAGQATAGRKAEVEKRDWSLKEGETIKVDIGRRGRRKEAVGDGEGWSGGERDALFSIKPPPGVVMDKGGGGRGGAMPTLAPPPSAQEARAEKRRSRGLSPGMADAKDLGFDDGEFGEFQ
ncbi:MAG: hypothetical protein Q9164_006291, partial [Protoblastenia rupestris]